jgi:hypothetical protein
VTLSGYDWNVAQRWREREREREEISVHSLLTNECDYKDYTVCTIVLREIIGGLYEFVFCNVITKQILSRKFSS